MKAKDYLSQLKKLDLMIENKMTEKEQWLALAGGTTTNMSGEKVKSSPKQDKMAEAVVESITIEAEIDMIIDSLWDKRQEIIKVIEQLEATEYNLLHKMYVGIVIQKDDETFITKYMTLEDVAELYDKTYSWATTTHGRALKNVQRILDERGAEDGCQ